MPEKIKIAWICTVSNKDIRDRANVRVGVVEHIIRKIICKPIAPTTPDVAVWNTNAFNEFKKHPEIELHIICPYSYLKDRLQTFEIEGIYYHLCRNENVSLWTLLLKRILRHPYSFPCNRRRINQFLDDINPDIVHLIGAENAFYALSILDIPQGKCPIIAQLQTLVSDPNFEKNYPVDKHIFRELLDSEQKVIGRAEYVGTRVISFKNIIHNIVKPNVSFLDTTLAADEPIDMSTTNKKYDFVYFAIDISKASDWAIESFAIARAKYPGLTLNIVGGYTPDFKSILDNRIKQLGLEDAVLFSGKLLNHEDVISQIKNSRYALLPLKIDYTSGTIREAMANGLPVVTTITEGTPKLNKDFQCVLLSEKNDFAQMANNMIRLIEEDGLAQTLKENSYRKSSQRISNKEIVDDYIENYRRVLNMA